MDWSSALKFGGFLSIPGYIFLYLYDRLIEQGSISDSIPLTITLLVFIFFFCSLMAWLFLYFKNKGNSGISDTKINDNDVEGNFEIGSRTNIKKSSIENNKVKGDFNIGQRD